MQVRDIVSNDDGEVVDDKGNPLPPCIVMERGESLDIWSARARPDRWQAFTVRPWLPSYLFISCSKVFSCKKGVEIHGCGGRLSPLERATRSL